MVQPSDSIHNLFESITDDEESCGIPAFVAKVFMAGTPPARSPCAEPSADECDTTRDNTNTTGDGDGTRGAKGARGGDGTRDGNRTRGDDGARGGAGALTREQLETLARESERC